MPVHGTITLQSKPGPYPAEDGKATFAYAITDFDNFPTILHPQLLLARIGASRRGCSGTLAQPVIAELLARPASLGADPFGRS